MIKKNIFKLLVVSMWCLCNNQAFSQAQIKVNSLFIPVGIYNIGIEKPLNNKFSVQGEIFISPWKSFMGKHLQIGMATLDSRYYFNNNQKGWYAGGYFSAAAFNLQKWNYLKATEDYLDHERTMPIYNEDGTIRKTEKYQKGYTFILGMMAGYKIVFKKKMGNGYLYGSGKFSGTL